MSEHAVTVGFLGAGQMGMPMVRRMHAAGVPLLVFARRPEAAAELAALGVRVTADLRELAAESDIVEVCLFSDEQLLDVLYADGLASALRPGSVFASHVTGSPALYTALAEAVAPGVRVVDAPISGTADSIAAGALTVLLGGDDDAVARVRPVLATFASPIIHVGPLGDGQRVKLVNNLLFALHVRLAGEAIRIGEGLGISQSRLVPAVMECSGASWALGLLADRPFALFEAGTRRYLDKDVAVVEEVAAELGVDLSVVAPLARRREA